MPVSSPDAIRVIVVGGYLGSGKTSLVNHVLAHAGGRHVVVLVNDFGRINIDEALISFQSDDVIALANGCICCTMGGELASALIHISDRRPRPDYLVIESSGVSDPEKIGRIAQMDRAYELDSIIVMIDAEQIAQQLRDPYVGDMVAQQIRAAHLLLLNKRDLIDAVTFDQRLGLLKTVVRRPKIIETIDGAMSPDLFFSGDTSVGGANGYLSLGKKSGFPRFDSFYIETGDFSDRDHLEHTLQSLPEAVLRAKGIVHLDDSLRTAFLVQMVGYRIVITPFPMAAPDGKSSLVLIGLHGHLNRTAVESSLNSESPCIFPAPKTTDSNRT